MCAGMNGPKAVFDEALLGEAVFGEAIFADLRGWRTFGLLRLAQLCLLSSSQLYISCG